MGKNYQKQKKLVAKEKLSIATTGDKNPRSRHIFCKELNIYFGTMQEASKILNLSLDKIRKMLNNGNSYNEKTLVEITKDEFFQYIFKKIGVNHYLCLKNSPLF